MAFSAMPDDALGDLLRGLGPELVVPAASSLPEDVRARIASAPVAAGAPWWRPTLAPRTVRRALIVALALVLLIAALAGAARLGLPGVSIVVGPSSTASLPPAPSPAPPGEPPGANAGLGRAATPAGAVAALGGPLPALPAPYGPPDAIYVDTIGRGIVNQVWGAAPGRPLADAQGVSLILTAMRATTDVDFIKKLSNGGARITYTRVDGSDAFWIEGAHEVLVLAENGRDVFDIRVAGDVLLWSEGGLTYRLESALGREASIKLAETMTAGS
jgi:hypothetical protein